MFQLIAYACNIVIKIARQFDPGNACAIALKHTGVFPATSRLATVNSGGDCIAPS